MRVPAGGWLASDGGLQMTRPPPCRLGARGQMPTLQNDPTSPHHFEARRPLACTLARADGSRRRRPTPAGAAAEQRPAGPELDENDEELNTATEADKDFIVDDLGEEYGEQQDVSPLRQGPGRPRWGGYGPGQPRPCTDAREATFQRNVQRGDLSRCSRLQIGLLSVCP